MKELSIKEKAKRYDETLKAAVVAHKDEDRHLKAALERIFPELKESEDERIRKALIDYFDDANKADENPLQSYGIHTDKAIAWLEKQSTPQVRTGLEWVNTIDDACDKRYAEEYAHGEYCHEQSFKWGFQEGVDWLEKQGESTDINPSEFDLHLNKLLKQFDTLPKEELASSLSFYLNVVQNDGTYKYEPKFKVGDIIKPKDGGHEPWQIMQVDMLDKKYRFKDGCVIHFSQEDAYELIERKPADKVEPKFKVGDWVVQENIGVYKVIEVCESWYEVISYNNEIQYSIGFNKENDCHLWTIQDAKDGDVLACESGWTCIFKKLNHNSFGGLLFDSYCFIDRTGWFCDGAEGHTLDERINGKIYPATKEQRDLLFQKMKEAGYEWSDKDRKLIKIVK